MAKEANIRNSLQIRMPSPQTLNYQGQPTQFFVDLEDCVGPAPGAFFASKAGTDVDLSKLIATGLIPSLCRIMNQDVPDANGHQNYVSFGLYDHTTFVYYPLGEVWPGETYILRLSRDLGQELGTGTGTGDVGAHTVTLRVKAHGPKASGADVLVEAFATDLLGSTE